MTSRHTKILALTVFLAGIFNISYCQNDTATNRTLKKIEKAAQSTGNTYALIIGISKYKNIAQLNYADDDAEAFRDLLIHTKVVNNPNDIRMLIDSEATEPQINSELRKISSKIKPGNNDRVIIYFAGHGDNDSETEQGYLLAYGCNDTVAYYDNDAVFLPLLESVVNGMAKKAQVILITDACRSGELAGKKKGALQTMKALNDGFDDKIIKILSCKPEQLSQEKQFPGGGHGVFTYYLLEALSGLSVDDNAANITITDIENYLPQKVSGETNNEQRPSFVYSKNEVIAKVDKEIRTAAMTNKAQGKGGYYAKRDVRGHKLNMSVDDSVYYKQFYEHLRAGRLDYPKGNNAHEIYKIAKKNVKNEELLNTMKYDLAAKLEDAVQPLLNRFIRAEFQDYPDSLFKDAGYKLKIVQEELLDSTDFQFNEIWAKRIFFIASVHKTQDDLILLRLADSLMPNSTFINFELGRHYSEVKESPDTALALMYFNKAIKLSPRWSYPRFMIGNIHYRKEEYTLARSYYTQAIDLQPKFAYALFNQAMTFKHLKLIDSADYYYQQALALDKSFENLWGKSERKTEDGIVSMGKSVRTSEVADESMFAGLLPPGLKKPVQSASVEATEGYNFYSNAYYHNLDGNTDSARYWYGRAIEMFEKAYAKKSMPLSYYYTWGYTYQALENYDKAKEIYKLALKTDTTDLDMYSFGIGWIEDKNEKIEEALKWYRAAIAYNPNYHQAYNNIGWAYNRMKNTDSAIYYYHRALHVQPNFSTTLANLGNIYFDLFKDDSAIYYYKLYNTYATAPDAYSYNRIGVSYEYMNQYDSAIAYYTEAIRINEKEPVFFRNMGNAYYYSKEYAIAVQYYERGNALLHDSDKTYFNLALSYSYMGEHKKAEKVFKKSLPYEKDNPELYLFYYNLGWTIDKLGNLEESAYWYAQTVKENPTYLNGLNNLGYVYDRLANYDSATYWYKEALKVDPAYTRAMYNLASLYNDLYSYDSALYYYKLLLPLATKDASVPYEIGQIHYYYGRYDSAVVYYERAISLNNKKTDYLAKAGDAYYYLKNYPKAIQRYNAALALDSTQYLTMNMLGLSYTYSFRYQEAISLYELALEKDARYKNTYEYNLACIYSLMGNNPDKAIDYLDKSITSGYNDLQHMNEDTDLDNIRSLPGFKAVMEKHFKPEEIQKYPGLYKKKN